MEAERDAEKDAPEEEADSNLDAAEESSNNEERNSQDGQRHPMVFAEPDEEAVFGEIGRVMGQR